jgi:hypothetical protein
MFDYSYYRGGSGDVPGTARKHPTHIFETGCARNEHTDLNISFWLDAHTRGLLSVQDLPVRMLSLLLFVESQVSMYACKDIRTRQTILPKDDPQATTPQDSTL